MKLAICLAFTLPAFSYTVYREECLPFKQFHEATYKVGWDIDFSPYSGGEDILFAHRILERAEGYLISKSPIWYSKSAQARIWRFSELYMGWLALNYLAVVAQHEVFGHGYRIRDIGRSKASVGGYSFNTPPPYGFGGAATHFSLNVDNFTTTDETAVSMAGVESTAILAIQTKFKWLEARAIDPRQVVLYLLSQHDLNLYIGSLKSQGDLAGHDIHSYIKALNQTYTSNFISGARLRSLSWINLGDPFTFYSIYSWFRYILSGKETAIPMIPIGKAGYLPNVRLGLTPFGPEFFVENFLLIGKTPYYFYGKGGSHSKNTYLGCGFYAPKIWVRRGWSVGARFDAWRQPELLLFPGQIPFSEINFDAKPDPNDPVYPYSEQNNVRYNSAGSLIFAYQTIGRSGFEGEFGYKGQGFLPGNALKASPIIRLFYSLRF
ncbi:MAG TPA: hypothetical protein VLE89_06775 [Chlamydiales bacterium]|nr:hypothetical protein [Chlamydiales bacterium]